RTIEIFSPPPFSPLSIAPSSGEAIRYLCRRRRSASSGRPPQGGLSCAFQTQREGDDSMILFGGDNSRAILVYGLVVLAILAFSYFVIVKPIIDTTNNTVNNAINQGLRQSQQALNQAARQQRRQAHQQNLTQRQDHRQVR